MAEAQARYRARIEEMGIGAIDDALDSEQSNESQDEEGADPNKPPKYARRGKLPRVPETGDHVCGEDLTEDFYREAFEEVRLGCKEEDIDGDLACQGKYRGQYTDPDSIPSITFRDFLEVFRLSYQPE